MLFGVEKTVAENVIRNYALQNPNKCWTINLPNSITDSKFILLGIELLL